MTVTLTSFHGRGEDEIAVTFRLSDGENSSFDTFVISAASFAEMKLSVGESSRRVYEEVSECGKVHSARKLAVSALGYGAYSRKALVRKLRVKGVEPAIAEEAVERLESSGYIDDLANAEREAERCVAKKWGARRISAALYQKGYGEEAVRKALYALEDSGVDFSENCAEIIESRYGEVPSAPDARRKLYAAMIRYGYSPSEINSAIEKLNDK